MGRRLNIRNLKKYPQFQVLVQTVGFQNFDVSQTILIQLLN